MNFAKPGISEETERFCSICHAKIKDGEECNHNLKVLCEDCCMNIRMTRVRKTHWQYLGSIKTQYLISGKST